MCDQSHQVSFIYTHGASAQMNLLHQLWKMVRARPPTAVSKWVAACDHSLVHRGLHTSVFHLFSLRCNHCGGNLERYHFS